MMDPKSGKLFRDFEEARAAGVKNPVQLIGRVEDLEHISKAVARADKAKNRAKNKKAKASRKQNRQ